MSRDADKERERHYLLEYMIKIYLANNTVLVRQAEGVGVQNKLVYFDLIARHEKCPHPTWFNKYFEPTLCKFNKLL